METKNSIRKQMLALRNEMNEKECAEKSEKIKKMVLSLPVVQNAKYILCYASYKSEVMTGGLIEEVLNQGKPVYLPKVDGDEMDFFRVESLDELSDGYKGIPEPSQSCTDIFTKECWEQVKEQTVMLLPGAVFSENGARIGYGKGYYDRYLQRIPCMERIALCYELQMAKSIPADIHDIPVTTIVTEEKVRHITGRVETK